MLLFQNVVNKIQNVDNYQLFEAVLIGIIFTFIFARSSIPVQGFLSIFVGVIIAYLWVVFNDNSNAKKEEDQEKDFDTLQKQMNYSFMPFFATKQTSVLYMNPALVKIFIKMCPFARFDPLNFKESLVSANQLVRIYESAKIGNQVPNQTIDIAEQLQRNVLNHMESLINSFPSTVIGDHRFQTDMSILQKILQKIINDIQVLYEDYYVQNGPNIYNPPPSLRAGPWKNPLKAKDYNKYWNFYY